MEAKTWTVLELIQWTTGFLKQKGIEGSRREAEDMLGSVLELDRLKLYLAFETLPTPPELAKFRELVARRAKHEPIQYILGWENFCGMKIKCDPRALIPRPETERLAELAVEFLKPLGEAGRFADVGTGTGCIALAILAKTGASGVATDLSPEALALARENAAALGADARLQFLEGPLCAPLEGSYDLIVSNPPYIPDGEREGLESEVKDHEPAGALFSGADGVRELRAILAEAPSKLKPGGALMLECGKGQPEALKAGLSGAWASSEIGKDQFDVGRFLLLRKGD